MARIGYGTTIEIDGLKIGQVTDAAISGISLATVDATHMESPGAFREFIGGLLDGGEITLTTQTAPVPVYGFGSADVNTTDDTIELPAGIQDETKVRFKQSGTALPSPFDEDTDYYLVEVDAGEYAFSADPSLDPLITITSTGTGSHFIYPAEDRWFQSYLKLQARSTPEITFNFPSGAKLVCDALITNFGTPVPLEDKITTNLTLKVTGSVDWQ